MFKIGDKVACPPHGVGIVEGKEEREVGGKKVIYFRISLVGKSMSILVPEESIENSGIRPVLSEESIEEIFNYLSEIPTNISEKWTVRHRLNVDRLKTGDIKELATVVRNLSYRSKEKELSYSEKRMFEEAFGKLAEEIALSLGEPVKKVKQKIRKILKGVKKP
ncbi:transcriptional regulator, CarD family [Desulfurobacterium thermolithotrophum DSM 11699]|uniref:Transcriptional regulator, CarD family n=1 Tax=Desulfurobacterium thermolithotrophum (strain DSM 11699 / BSA) TaxID=868864 RepID=F0S3C8_DESTD|nr:CarD family transcriptional regulator [Desulfurobacterium thermolithotrophum]ADY73350.1 transcriptional regulator, CarD family [Desulfurobacterium thermolithotrophum DSM 11699]